jgi:hypothetical protein
MPTLMIRFTTFTTYEDMMLQPTGPIDLGYRPHRFQHEIHQLARRFTVVVAHRRFGKTVCSETTLIDAALRTTKREARFSYIAPFLKQAKRTAWDYLKYYSRNIPGINIREGGLIIQYPNAARISLFGADNPEAMRGVCNDGVVLDEVADFRPDVWPAIIRPTLSDRKGWAFFIGTPKGINAFHDLYQYACEGRDGVRDPEWAGVMYRADETGLIPEAELESARRIMSPALYRQEMLCDFSASQDNLLITIDLVSAAMRKSLSEYDVAGLPKIVGVDIARFGDDRSVIQKRQGLAAFEPIVMQGLDNMEVVGRVSAIIREWEPDAVFVDAGRGEGVIDRLRQLGYDVTEVNFGAKPTDPTYVNKRSEMWDEMAKWFTAGGVIPNNPDLKTDLCVPTYRYDAANRFVLESKDDIKKRGMKSPDLGDALALTFAYKVAPPSRRARAPRSAVTPYDEFSEMSRGGHPYASGAAR